MHCYPLKTVEPMQVQMQISGEKGGNRERQRKRETDGEIGRDRQRERERGDRSRDL